MLDPDRIVRRAYEALADDEFDDVLDLLDSAEFDRVVTLRSELLSRLLADSGQPDAPSIAHACLVRWGLRSADDLHVFPVRHVLRAGLAALPQMRRKVRCEVDRWERSDDDRAIVFFRVWPERPPSTFPAVSVTARLTLDGWRLRPRWLSPWLLWGLENTFLDGAA